MVEKRFRGLYQTIPSVKICVSLYSIDIYFISLFIDFPLILLFSVHVTDRFILKPSLIKNWPTPH